MKYRSYFIGRSAERIREDANEEEASRFGRFSVFVINVGGS